MAFEIPTVAAVAQRAQQAFRTNLKGSDAFLWPNNLLVSAKVMAGAVWEAFSFLEYIQRQFLAQTADGIWLDRHAEEYGMARLAATFASGAATISGDAGTAVPSGLELQRADGLRFTTTGAGTISGLGTVDVPVRCQTAGRTGNTAAGAGLALVTPLARVRSEAVAAAGGVGGGADTESDESLRERVLARKRLPPHGGAVHDYVAWAREINGVTRVYVDPVTATNGRQTVGVWFLMDDTYANGIPLGADVARLRAYIETVRPAGAIVDYAAPVPITLNIVIDNLSPDTTAVRDSIVAELRDMLRYEARVSTATEPFTLYRSLIVEAIARATGEHHHTLTTPATDVAYTTGQIPVLGTVTFT